MNADEFRARAAALDTADPLAIHRSALVPIPPGLVYLDGNSLGRPTARGRERAIGVLDDWATRLVEAWDDWIDLPWVVGDRLGGLIGSAPGQCVVGDSTSVQLYKVVHAVARNLDRPTVLVPEGEFPTDRYVAAGVADALGGRCATFVVPPGGIAADELADLVRHHRADVVVISMVDFRSGARLDVAECTTAVRGAGAVVVWDLSHAAGVVPVHLDAWGVDAAVGCTYKYLHGGPGAPAFAYVRASRQAEWRQPIWGWWGQRDQFAMGDRYDPGIRMRQFGVGTPPVIGLALVDEGVALVESAGLAAIDAKRAALGALTFDLVDVRLGSAQVETPRVADRRGGHVSLRHPDASRISRAGRDRGIVADFRPPDRLRLGLAPLSTSFVDVVTAVETFATIVDSTALDAYTDSPGRVT